MKKQLVGLGRDREAGDRGHETKKQRREREQAERAETGGKTALATKADKKVDIKIKGTFLKCPTIVGPNHPCGAHYRKGVACAKMLATRKCYRDHTPINDLSPENKIIWFDHVAKTETLNLNAETVTFKKENGAYVRPA